MPVDNRRMLVRPLRMLIRLKALNRQKKRVDRADT